MYKYFLLAILLLIPFSIQAQENYSWSDLDESCFEKSLKINVKEADDFLLELVPEGNLFFVSQNNLVLNRVYSEGKEKFLDYKILSMTGVVNTYQANFDLLNDNNFSTKLFFDHYDSGKKIIDIELNKIAMANSIQFNMEHSRTYRVEYYISEQGQSYARVARPENFNFKFLRIEFININKDNIVNQTLTVSEINFIQKAKMVYVVDNAFANDVYVYAAYNCEDTGIMQKVLQKAQDLVGVNSFAVNADTEKYKLELSTNPSYNNDFDKDLISNNLDNCPFVSNKDQADIDKDLVGDVCDLDNDAKNFYDKDSDKDGVADSLDNCPSIFNPKQEDGNADKKGNLCSDDDRDGIIGYKDNCIKISNRDQTDINVNGVGDACEFDKDNDKIFDSIDNCISFYNPSQRDTDKDYIGDECDNCNIYNPRQIDKNNNDIGDVCEKKEENIVNNDKDADRIIDSLDNCKDMPNTNQNDEDGDGVGDLCDNCLSLKNPNQVDKNNNGAGDMCEDVDLDGIVSYLDNCMEYANPDQADSDNDGTGDVCEDDDKDTVVALKDNCPFVYNKDQADIDGDGVGDKCDDKDDRFIESNKGLFISFIVFVTIIFGAFISIMIRKIRSGEASNYDETDNEEEDKDGSQE